MNNFNVDVQFLETQIKFDFDRICVDQASRAVVNKTARARPFGGLIKGKVMERDA